ncbi:MAG TPA: hypothetical protein VFV72_08590 [Candidatus Limnocylindrales bacterium]|nr:hypothetical protein [Candidatus Limnocylindrales bacterium]
MQPTAAYRAPLIAASRRSALWLGVSVVVFAWSTVEFVSLLTRHTTGAELYGVLVAALAVVAGALTVYLVASTRRRVFATWAVIALWGFIALGGLAGVVAHVVGPVPGHGPVDTRPRPIPAPLIFTVLGAVGGVAVHRGQRATGGRLIERSTE